MKKATKILFTFVLSLILFFNNSYFAFASDNIIFESEIIASKKYNTASNGSLDNLTNYIGDIEVFQKYLFNCISTDDSNITNGTQYGSIDISSYNIPKNDTLVKELSTLLFYESPELFRVGTSFRYSYTSTGKLYSISPLYNIADPAEYREKYADFVKKSKKLLQGIENNNQFTDVEKALLIHDRLALHCEYDQKNLDSKTLPETAYNAYGIICLGSGVCMGYALAYDYLLEQVGIEAEHCSSDALDHAWNIVYIDNKPYHVDVTWDDPTWDKYGRVSHDNFLRSTAGIKSTGHTATDFKSTPVDTTYDNYYWQSTESAFQLIDNEYYYHVNETNEVLKRSDLLAEEPTLVTTIPFDTWTASSGGYWQGNFSRLSSDGHYLYYNTKDKVYRYNPKTNSEEIVFEPDLTTYGKAFWIYSMVFSDCKLMCEIFNTPNYTADVRKDYIVTVEIHTPSDWVITKEPTKEEPGERQKICLNCSQITHTEIPPRILIEPIENTNTIVEDNIIFTGVSLCENIKNIVIFSENTTYETSASFKNSTTEFLGTGSIISIFENGEKIAEYTIVIDGDLDGDSVCDGLDVALTELAMNKNRIPSSIECYAANGMALDEIDINSFQYVVNTAIGDHL